MNEFKLVFADGFDKEEAMTLRVIKPANPDMHGVDVASWQQLLGRAGFSPGDIDGSWGDKSDAALRAFQRAQGLKVDGIIGADTGERLIEGHSEI